MILERFFLEPRDLSSQPAFQGWDDTSRVTSCLLKVRSRCFVVLRDQETESLGRPSGMGDTPRVTSFLPRVRSECFLWLQRLGCREGVSCGVVLREDNLPEEDERLSRGGLALRGSYRGGRDAETDLLLTGWLVRGSTDTIGRTMVDYLWPMLVA